MIITLLFKCLCQILPSSIRGQLKPQISIKQIAKISKLGSSSFASVHMMVRNILFNFEIGELPKLLMLIDIVLK